MSSRLWFFWWSCMDVSWTIKKAEHWRLDAFEQWCWRRLLRVPWIARWSNLSILKEISPGISLEGVMLKLKLQYFGHLMRRVDKDSDPGRDWGQEDKGMTEDLMVGWHHWLNAHGFGWTPEVGDGQGCLPCWGSWDCKESDTNERLNWTELILIQGLFFICGTSAYICLPLKCKGKCSLGYIILSVNSVVRYSPIPHKTIHFWTRTWEVLDQWDLPSFLSSLS